MNCDRKARAQSVMIAKKYKKFYKLPFVNNDLIPTDTRNGSDTTGDTENKPCSNLLQKCC